MSRRVRIITILCCAIALAACSATPMRRNLKEAWRDGVIKADVKMRLASNNDVKARYVNVDVFRGVVSLNGRVETPAQQKIAEELARQTNEVVLVENHLVIQSPNDPRFMMAEDDADMHADAIAVEVSVPAQARTATRSQVYSDLAVGDPLAGKSAPAATMPRVMPPVQYEAPRVAVPTRTLPAPRAPTPSRSGSITTPDRTYSDLAVGDSMSPGRHRVPAPAPRAIVKAPTPAPAPKVAMPQTTPSTVSPRQASTIPAKPSAPIVTAPALRTMQEPRYLDKGVIPPAASLNQRTVAKPMPPPSRPVPSLTAGTQEATRTPVVPHGAIDSGLAQEAAEELRRLKAEPTE